MDQRFLRAAAPQSAPRILGVRLRPFSLWHAACLMMVGSPYIVPGRDPNSADMLTALMICADTRDAALSSWARLERSRVRRAILGARLYLAGDRPLVVFADWLSAQLTDLPEVYRESTATASTAVPWPYQVAVALLSRFHCFRNDSEAWDLPVVTAVCYVTALSEWSGAKIVDPEEDAKADAAMAAFDAATKGNNA